MPKETPGAVPEPEDFETLASDAALNLTMEAAAVAPDAEPTEPTEPAEPAAAEPSEAFRAAKEAGLDLEGYENDAALIAGLHKQVTDAQPFVDYARQVLPYDQQVRQVINPPVEETTTEEPEKAWDLASHFKDAWKQPEFDKGWDAFLQSGMVEQNESGQYVPAEGQNFNVPPHVLQGLNEHRVWQRQALETLVNNPYQPTWEAFQEPLQRMIEERITQTIGDRDNSRSLTDWEAKNAALLYEQDGEGKTINDIYGNPKTTQYGEALIGASMELREAGITDTDTILRLATQIASSDMPTKDDGAPSPEEEAPPKDQSFIQEAIQKAGHAPSSGGFAEGAGADPVALNNAELDSMFSVAAKKAGLY